MTASKAQQETAVGQGLAVGCLALGVVAVTADKLTVELAFARAWRAWPSAAVPGRTDVARRQRPPANPQVERWPQRRRHRLVGNRPGSGSRSWVPASKTSAMQATLAVGTDVPPAEWASLAHGFVTALGSAHIRTDPSVAVDVTDDHDDDDHDPAGPDDDSGYGPGSYFAHAVDKDD